MSCSYTAMLNVPTALQGNLPACRHRSHSPWQLPSLSSRLMYTAKASSSCFWAASTLWPQLVTKYRDALCFLSPLKGSLSVLVQEGHHPDERPLTLACHAAEDPDTGRMTIRMRVLKPLTAVDKTVVAAAVAATSGKPPAANSEQQTCPGCPEQTPATSSCS